jgi:hypothetical protein
MSKKQKGVNPALESAISKLLEQVMNDPQASLTDKCRVLDRSINVEKLKQKLSDDEWGSGFITSDDDDDSEN